MHSDRRQPALFLTHVCEGYFGAAAFTGSKNYPALRPVQREMKGLSEKNFLRVVGPVMLDFIQVGVAPLLHMPPSRAAIGRRGGGRRGKSNVQGARRG